MNIIVAFILLLGIMTLGMTLNALHAFMLLHHDGFPLRESCVIAAILLVSIVGMVFAFHVMAVWQMYWYVYAVVIITGVGMAVSFMRSASKLVSR